MALTEHEQHQLRLLSEQLFKDDPRLAAKLAAGAAPDPPSGRIGAGTLSLLVGQVVFSTGVGARTPALGVLGFALTVAGAYLISQRFQLRRGTSRAATRHET
jgi:hypothetical protein